MRRSPPRRAKRGRTPPLLLRRSIRSLRVRWSSSLVAQWVSTEEEEERRISREGSAAAARRLHISTISSSKLDRDQARRGREGGDPSDFSPATDGLDVGEISSSRPGRGRRAAAGGLFSIRRRVILYRLARSSRSFSFSPFMSSLCTATLTPHNQIIQQRSKLFHSHVHTLLSNPRPPSCLRLFFPFFPSFFHSISRISLLQL